jgi:two-component system nitrate/nitrite sensor histidine kinase NarX
MYASNSPLTEVYDRLARALSAGADVDALLTGLLALVAQQSQARAASVSAVGDDGQMRQLGALQQGSAGGSDERTVLIPLTYRGRTLGQYELRLAAKTVIDGPIAEFHRTLGALLGLALHDACADRESRRAVLADVHDGIAQTLVYVRMRLPLLEDAIARHDDVAARRYCDDVRRGVSSAHTNLRAILVQSQASIDPQGLKHALSSSVRSFQDQTQVDLVFDDRAPDLQLTASQESQVFLIVQEALANIAKHARARHAWLHIDRQGDQVDVVVEDDGAGPPATANAASHSHFGIEIMRQRAARLGGGVEIAAREGGGMRMRLSFPVAEVAST